MQISKWIIAIVAVYGGLGGVLFDAVISTTSRQHIRNPAWPPHAKFHNGQTMMMGVLNAITVLVLLFAITPPTLPLLLVAAAVGATTFIAMLLAPAFPGTGWSDPEFEAINPRPLGIPVHKLLSLIAIGVMLAAVGLAILQS